MKVLVSVPLVLVFALASVGSATEERLAPAQLADQGLGVYGRVLRPGTREPVIGAQVRIEAVRGEEQTAATTTDTEGRFRFAELTAGRYYVTLPSPTSADASSAATARTKTVDVRSGEIPPDLVLWLPLGASVSGRVTGPDGDPLPDFDVALWRLGWDRQRTLLPASDSTQTDEDGRYELHAPPGEYYIEVSDASQATDYPRHYYPGVLYPEDGVLVPLRAGIDLTGIDVSMRETDAYRVRFDFSVPPLPGVSEPLASFLDDGALPLRAIIRPVGPGRIDMGRIPHDVGLERIDADIWTIEQRLGPGEYDLMLAYPNELLSRVGPEVMRRREIVRTRITVNPDVADETGGIDLGAIPATPRISVPGRVVVQGLDDGSLDVTRLGFNLTAEVATDGTFVLEDLMPDTYGFSVRSLPEGWYVASIRRGGRDVLLDGLDVSGGDQPVEVVVANGAGGIQGVTRSESGALIPGSRVVLIPPPERRGPQTQFPTATTNVSGAYRLDGIPPGDYRLIALDEAGTIERGRFERAWHSQSQDHYWEDPDFLREYELRGERITVDPGARMIINAEAIPIYE